MGAWEPYFPTRLKVVYRLIYYYEICRSAIHYLVEGRPFSLIQVALSNSADCRLRNFLTKEQNTLY